MSTKTKIVATIGPASSSEPVLQELLTEGVNVVRLNFSHGTHAEHLRNIENVRRIAFELDRPVAILLDLQGPKIRTGLLQDQAPVVLEAGQTIKITPGNSLGTAQEISTGYPQLVNDVQPGDRILIDDGLIELRVLSKNESSIDCRIVSGGVLKEHKGINLPGVTVSVPALTEKDRADIRFGIEAGVDYFALSFVRTPEDLHQIRTLVTEQGADIPIIAKIEKPEAVENLAGILAVSDGIMVARGDLGVELNPAQIPAIQKRIISEAVAANKPVITATQMLETMCVNPIPTRAEASDVANAIFDGTDAIMLSGETASGKYPVQAVRMMRQIAEEAEGSPFINTNLHHPEGEITDSITQVIAQSAVTMLMDSKASGVVVFTVSGSTAKQISKQRPAKAVYAFTPNPATYNRLSLLWGVTPYRISMIDGVNPLICASEKILTRRDIARQGELIAIVVGEGLQKGTTNLIKMHRVGAP